MRFADVNGEKIGAVFVIVIELDEVAYLAAERRSGVAAKYEDEGALADAMAEMECGLAVESDEADVRSEVADLQIAAMPLRQGIAQESVDIARAASDVTQKGVADNQEGCESKRSPFPPSHRNVLRVTWHDSVRGCASQCHAGGERGTNHSGERAATRLYTGLCSDH
jgi:hypothetical protein